MIRTLPFFLLVLSLPSLAGASVPPLAQKAAAHAVAEHDDEQLAVLANLVEFRTVHEAGTQNAGNPEFRAFADYLRERALAYGLDFTDLGAVLVIGLGDSTDRLGIVTHGDVQPADPAKWQKSPFELDTTSEPGRLIARGAEDDKSPIATALLAMRSIRELGLPLSRRIELIVSLTEESDWAPFLEVLERWEPPALNIAIDSDYPAVVAEKGWGGLWLTFAAAGHPESPLPRIERFEGGAFISQVPADARIEIANADAALVARLRERAGNADDGVQYRIGTAGSRVVITATGQAVHSSTPEYGQNALTHAAALLEGERFADTAAGRVVGFTNALLGTGLYGERFGDAAYSHPFMGPLTVNLSTVKTTDAGVEVAINTRAPAGKTAVELEREMRDAIAGWAKARDVAAPAIKVQMSDAYYPERPPHVEPLLAVFRHYTGDKDAQAISIGGGTNARLLPNGINFGPSMPGVPYTGHSEHEFISRAQLTLNLRMYTAMMTWLATDAFPDNRLARQ